MTSSSLIGFWFAHVCLTTTSHNLSRKIKTLSTQKNYVWPPNKIVKNKPAFFFFEFTCCAWMESNARRPSSSFTGRQNHHTLQQKTPSTSPNNPQLVKHRHTDTHTLEYPTRKEKMAITRDNPEMQCSIGGGGRKKRITPLLLKKIIFISLQRYFLSVNNVQRTDTHTHTRPISSCSRLGTEFWSRPRRKRRLAPCLMADARGH